MKSIKKLLTKGFEFRFPIRCECVGHLCVTLGEKEGGGQMGDVRLPYNQVRVYT